MMDRIERLKEELIIDGQGIDPDKLIKLILCEVKRVIHEDYVKYLSYYRKTKYTCFDIDDVLKKHFNL